MELWRAFAKVNLELRVGPKRTDGYHEIRTVLQTVDLADEIRVRRSDEFRFTATEGPADESNLVVRAVRSFERETAISVKLGIDLVKRIPSGAGLGGGSADAAVTLLGLNRWFRTRIAGERLNQILTDLGSDVPFFAVGGRALAIGRGEVVFPLQDTVTDWLVLVSPPKRAGTAEAYSWLTEDAQFNSILGFCARFNERDGYAHARLNDFETPLFRRFPELAEIKRKLSAAGARFASLTGSGTTLFGQFSTEAAAKRAIEALRGDLAVIVRPIGRSEYFDRMFGG
jgi:4-diphosphocytidyl-2-C-methyl-D-erythritol kinase